MFKIKDYELRLCVQTMSLLLVNVVAINSFVIFFSYVIVVFKFSFKI